MQVSHRISVLSSAAIAACAVLSVATPAQAAPSSYEAAVLANNPYVYHRLNEAAPISTGTVAQDATAADRDGVYQGSPTGGATGVGLGSDSAVSFPGTGTGATGSYFGNSNILPFGSSIGTSSYEFVFKVNPGFDSTVKQSLFGIFDPSASPTDVEVTLNSQGNDALATTANTTRFYVRGNDVDAQGVHFTNATLYDGNYHHLVFTFDASQTGAAQFAAYVDGVQQVLTLQQVGSGAADANADPDGFTNFDNAPTWAARNVRGALGSTAVQRLANVTIDETALYTSILSSAQVVGNAEAAGFVVPEPGSLALAGFAAFGLLARRRRQA